jgi:hypothetical protein
MDGMGKDTQQGQLNLFHHISALDAIQAMRPDEIDISFLLRTYCIAGLPLTRPKDDMQPFHRIDTRVALTVSPQSVALPGGTICPIGVPFGPQSRVLMMWAATEARDHRRSADDRWLEIGRIRPWLESIGLKPYSRAVSKTKDQLIRISFVHFTIVMDVSDDGTTLFSNESIVDGGMVNDDLEHYAAGDLHLVRWPGGLRLSQSAFDHFRNDSVPIPTSRLPMVAHSALSLDILAYLCYRLPMLPKRDSVLVTWRELIAQFGNKEYVSKFRSTFDPSIAAALRAYPEANVSISDEGLLLRYSDPAVLREPFISVPRQIAVGHTRNRAPRKKEKGKPMPVG